MRSLRVLAVARYLTGGWTPCKHFANCVGWCPHCLLEAFVNPATRTARLRQNAFGRWIVVHPTIDELAWSGARWVAIGKSGCPLGSAQVSNLDTREEAAEYAASFGFEVTAAAV